MTGAGENLPPGSDDPGAAESVALRILGGATQSASALARRLARRGFSSTAVEEAVRRCTAAGYVDDDALAGSVAARHRRAGHGRSRVAADLRARGVDSAAITHALEGMEAGEEEAALAEAHRLWNRAVARDAGDPKQRQRVAAALQRRGYATGLVIRVMRDLQ